MTDVAVVIPSSWSPAYLIEVLDDDLGSAPNIDCVFRLSERPTERAIALAFHLKRERIWRAIFYAGPTVSDQSINRVVVLPEQKRVLVVVEGQGYLVAPDEHCFAETIMHPFPITDLVVIEHLRMVLMLGAVSVTAFGVHGMMWSIDELGENWLTIDSVTGDQIVGKTWSGSAIDFVPFVIRISDGSILMEGP